jgi:hypothetical protein
MRLLDGIGATISQYHPLTFDDELDLFLKATEAFPDETIYIHTVFTMMDVFRRNSLYNISTRAVSVNTPEMQVRLERAKGVPNGSNSISVEYTPEGIRIQQTTSNDGFYRAYIEESSVLLKNHIDGGLWNLASLFLQDHPNVQYSPPVMLGTQSGDVGFMSAMNISIMRNAIKSDSAWEFLRFMMEFEDNLHFLPDYIPNPNYFRHYNALPINKNRFETQTYWAVDSVYFESMTFAGIADRINDEHRDINISTAMDFLRSYMELLNLEVRGNVAVIQSLIYPEIWLLYSGRQDVARTLANIQNRLELYVNE